MIHDELDSALEHLELIAGADGYVIYKQGVGYTVKLRAAVGHSTDLDVAIRCAILADHKQAVELDEELSNMEDDDLQPPPK